MSQGKSSLARRDAPTIENRIAGRRSFMDRIQPYSMLPAKRNHAEVLHHNNSHHPLSMKLSQTVRQMYANSNNNNNNVATTYQEKDKDYGKEKSKDRYDKHLVSSSSSTMMLPPRSSPHKRPRTHHHHNSSSSSSLALAFILQADSLIVNPEPDTIESFPHPKFTLCLSLIHI